MDDSIFFSEMPFTLWSKSHILPMVLYFILGAIAIYYGKKKLETVEKKRRLLFYLSLLPFIALLIQNLARAMSGVWTIQEDLPIHICRILALFAPLVYLRNSKFWTGVFYFWILVGALNAVFAADIRFDFPHYKYITYFFVHLGLIPLPIYHCYVLGRRIDLKDLWNTYWVVNTLLLITMALNFTIGSNYMYTRHKPEVASLMDVLGPWPWYLVMLQFLGLALFFVAYLPFYFIKKKENKNL